MEGPTEVDRKHEMAQGYNAKVVELINSILHEKFEIPLKDLVPSACLKNDLKLDSLDFVDMFVMLEQQTGRNVQDLDLMSIRKLGDIYKIVSQLEIDDLGSQSH